MFTKCFDLTHDVACLHMPIVNVCFIGERGASDRSWVLVDAGSDVSGTAVRAAAAERFGEKSRPAAIILTHGHFDHVAGLSKLSDEWDAPIYIHKLELPYVTGRSSYPPPDPAVGGGLMSMISFTYPRGPFQLGDRVRPIPEDGSVPGASDWRWIHTPGHTAGHISLFRDFDRSLIVGDAFVTTKQESALGAMFHGHPRVRRPPAYYTSDWGAARRSVAALAELEPEIAMTGHGQPMSGEPLRQQLHALVRDWDQVAVPSRGRYVRQPAITNENGIVSLPPPVPDRNLLMLAGLSATAALVMLALWSRD